MSAYYNEIDPFMANWLRNLIKAGHLPPGDVDERSIENVPPDELAPYTQIHFFAGIGGWAYALRLAGWPDDKPVMSGSCPCQPYSVAGKGAGFDDERHLWPAMFWIIQQCRPPVIFGEQVSSKPALKWWDLVASDLEGIDYAAASADLPAASVGALHRRQRLFWVANTDRPGRQWERSAQATGRLPQSLAAGASPHNPVANSESSSRGLRVGSLAPSGQEGVGCNSPSGAGQRCAANPLANAQSPKRQRCGHSRVGRLGSANGSSLEHSNCERQQEQRHSVSDGSQFFGAQLPSVDWQQVEWIDCLDGKQRPVEPSIRLLAHGLPGRVAMLRGYGNAIVPQVAAEFIKAAAAAIHQPSPSRSLL